MGTKTTEEETAVREAVQTFALLSRTLKAANFLSLPVEGQAATLEEARGLLFSQYVAYTNKRQILTYLDDLLRGPITSACHDQIEAIKTAWDTPPF